MKSIFIKLGKTVGVFKNEGIASGFSKMGSALARMFQKAEPGDVLFVTSGGGAGASARYRVSNQMEELELQGIRCSSSDLDSPYLLSYADKFKIFILVRPFGGAKMKKFVEKLKELNKEIIFETDDLLFDPQYLSRADYLKNISPLEKPLYENGLGREILEDPYVEACVTATSYLADILRQHNKKVFVSTNKLSVEECEIAENLIRNKSGHNPEEIRIGYFSGTASHDKDFAEIAGALENILEKYPNVKLFLVGPLKIGERFDKFGDRIIRQSFVSGRKKYLETVSKADINLAPLEKNNPFCEAKSELKWIGAGILGISTVASATQTFREAIQDGEDGSVADSEKEWFNKLEQLIKDADLREKMGEAARRSVLKKYTTQNAKNEEYYNYLKSKL